MKKKNALRLSIVLAAFAIGALILTLIIRQSSNLDNLKNGRAIFHSYDFEIVDSIIRTSSTEQLVSKILIQSDPENALFEEGILEPQTKYAAGYIAEKDCITFPAQFDMEKRMDSLNLLIKGISQNGSLPFASDSVFIPTWHQLNSITSDSLFIEYHNYHTSFISSLGFNSKVIDFSLPVGSDKQPFKWVLERLRTEVSNLHNNRILSILDIRGKSLSNDSLVYESQIDFFSNLITTGLCGVICDRIENLELLDSLGFDGLFIYQLKEKENLSKEIVALSDAFILPNDESEPNKEVASKIGKQLKTNPLRKKAFKIVRAALWANMLERSTFVADYLTEDLLRSNITKSSLILLKNSDSLIPFSNINQKFLVINTTGENIFHFKDRFSKYSPNATFIEHTPGTSKTLNVPAGTDQLIVLTNTSLKNLNKSELAILENHKSITYVHSGENISNSFIGAKAVILIYEMTDQSLSYSAQMLFGGIPSIGILSYDLNDTLMLGFGINTKKTRLEYTYPENAGLCSNRLQNIDSIMINAIISGAFPGAQILVAKNGKVIFDKTFGHHDYSRSRQVQRNDLYDVASITKIAATTLAAMKLQEQGKLNIFSETGRYFKDTKIDYRNIVADTIRFIDTLNIQGISKVDLSRLVKDKDTVHLGHNLVRVIEKVISQATPKNNIFKIPIRNLLVHQSGMSPSLPILPYVRYKQTFNQYQALQRKIDEAKEIAPRNGATEGLHQEKEGENLRKITTNPFNFFYSKRKIDGIADIWVAENKYLRNQFRDSIYHNVKRLRVHPNPRLQYACMNMILVQMVIDSINKTNLDTYLKVNFFNPLGMRNSSYNPLRFYGKSQIIPTENDRSWRSALVHGTVHDPSAALLGGVAGNAGLFSTASDLAILGQMWLNLGTYGGRKYLNPSTIKTFTEKQPENHRGLGFDKPSDKGIHAESLPKSAYGHLGFTGCAMWIDPENEIVFIFLSNRIHPSVNNQRINTSRIRQRIHQVVYDAFLKRKN